MKSLYIFLIYFIFLYGGIEILAYIADKRGSRDEDTRSYKR